MADICKPKPNRTKVRVFTERDIARITRYAIDDGANPFKILVFVALVSGFAATICQIVKSLSVLSQLGEVGKSIAQTLASMTILNLLIKRFGGTLVKFSPIAQLIVLASALTDIMLSLEIANVDNAIEGEKAIEFIKEWCDSIDELGEEIINYIRL